MVRAVELLGGDIQRLVVNALCPHMKLDGAVLALAVAVAGVAVPGEAHGHGTLADERDQAQAVGDELVVEDGGVHLDFHQIYGDCGDFGDHDAAESVGDAGVGLPQLEPHVVILHLPNFDFGESLV